MELSPLLLTSFAMVLAIVILRRRLKGKSSRRVYRLPPGPRPWPVIGNFNLIGALPHRSIHELSKKHGELMHLRFGSYSVVVASSAETAKLFLKTHDLLFLDRPRTAAGKHTTYDYADITWSPYGAYWRHARRICATQLFSPARLASFEHIRVEEVRSLVRGLFAAAGSGRAVPVRLGKDHLSTLSMNVITRMVLGKRLFDAGDGGENAAAEGPVSSLPEFMWMTDELMLLNGVLNIGDWIPWLDWLDLQGYVRRMKRIAERFDAFLEHVLDAHSQSQRRRRERDGESFVARDMVDVLMQLADDPTFEVQIGRVGVKAFTQDLIVGGTEPVSATVEWAMSELLRKPSVFAMAAEELDRVVGRGRWVTEKDVAHLPYLQAVVKETMRVHPIAPLLPPHVAREDASVGGYDIPKGTHVLVNVWTIGRDPALWDAPEEFRPERFVGSKIDVKGQDFELLPFGSGRRMCPGYNLGLKEIQLSLANLLHGFTWRLPEGMAKEDLSMDELFGLSTTRKFPLEVVVQPRFASELYA
ncbi:unnamed protein product [Miscanthus lutarioriparius]|uniref:Uncharacterized protein n=1 Tax=Miscanthus lutarioriparius TaxID=422564 RepID=A0A811PHR3_9POAL|nr:unnamed protein product [Miscanthus lutarioriparius]